MKPVGPHIRSYQGPEAFALLRNRIVGGEGFHLDFKYHIDDAARIARSLSAFANCGGGSLLIGVKDNGRIVGVRTDEEYYILESANQRHLRPRLCLRFAVWQARRKTVLEVRVNPARRRPIFVWDTDRKWRAYLRIADRNIRAPRPWVAAMKRRHQSRPRRFSFSPTIRKIIRHFEAAPQPATLTELQRSTGAPTPDLLEALTTFILFDLLTINIENDAYTYLLTDTPAPHTTPDFSP